MLISHRNSYRCLWLEFTIEVICKDVSGQWMCRLINYLTIKYLHIPVYPHNPDLSMASWTPKCRRYLAEWLRIFRLAGNLHTFGFKLNRHIEHHRAMYISLWQVIHANIWKSNTSIKRWISPILSSKHNVTSRGLRKLFPQFTSPSPADTGGEMTWKWSSWVGVQQIIPWENHNLHLQGV